MNATVDYDALLELLQESEHYSLPFAFRPRRGADPVDLIAPVQAAIDSANVAAIDRIPDDPTWCTECTLAGSRIVAEVAKGVMTDDEVLAWLSDFSTALGDLGGKVQAHPPDRRIPHFHDWNELPPSLTAFLNFVPADPSVWSWRTTPAVRDLCDELAEWSHLPGSTAISQRGLASFVTPAAVAGREMRTSAEVDEQHGLWQITRRPRRARIVEFGYIAKGWLQVVDETVPPIDCLPTLLDGLRIVAPHLRSAHVRRAHTVAADELDAQYVLQRRHTEAEELARYEPGIHLLSDYVIDAYVAQVLTTAHMDKIGSPEGFDVDDLNAGRYLVVAKDPDPWLSDLNPDQHVLEDARRQFAPAMLTADVAAANARRS